jgi:cyclophilin family peptidyl-prolyl cis-trans isomerase
VDEKADASVPNNGQRLRLLANAEWSRDPSGILPEDLVSRDSSVRRAAVRAVARIARDASRTQLERSLADEDPEVVAWAAFGLGRVCTRAHADATVRRIVARAATLMLASAPGSAELANAVVDPWFALAQALGRCATTEAQRILRSWMSADPELARVAVQGLDYYVQATKELEASTIVALLEAAEKDRRLVVALLPVSRLDRLEPLIARRLLTMAPQLLEKAGEERRYLLRALPLAGKDSIPILERTVIDDGHYHPLERVEAIRALGKLDAPGQVVLARLMSRIVTFASAPSEAELLSPKWLIWAELFEQLKEAPKFASAALGKLAALEIAAERKPAEYRRISYLRCHAAALLSGDDLNSALVEHCDATKEQREKKLAQLAILDRQQLKAKGISAFEMLAADRDPIVAMAALGLVANHDELPLGTELLTEALGAESMGIVATAARMLVGHSPRVNRKGNPNADLAAALERALGKSWPADAVEVRVSLLDAVADLGFLNAKSKIVAACKSEVPKIREHAELALHRLGEPNLHCEPPAKRELPKEHDHVVVRPITLRFHTDIGPTEIRLDPRLAPVAVTRLVDLANAGFYDGMLVHRVVPGFVVQFGDRSGDGFGGAGLPPIPCELSPQPFGPLDVGMALSGLDSGSSQVFVTLGPYPQLGGEYTRVGRAGVGWDQLFVGDRIDKVEVVP